MALIVVRPLKQILGLRTIMLLLVLSARDNRRRQILRRPDFGPFPSWIIARIRLCARICKRPTGPEILVQHADEEAFGAAWRRGCSCSGERIYCESGHSFYKHRFSGNRKAD